jgi:hypothetical protein
MTNQKICGLDTRKQGNREVLWECGSNAALPSSFREPNGSLGTSSPKAPSGSAAQPAKRQYSLRSSGGLVKPAYLTVYRDARLVEVHLPGIAPLNPARRGECSGMSDESRRRLLSLLNCIVRTARLPIMLTLTFPEEVTVTAQEAKHCERQFWKRIQRSYEHAAAFWRLEAHPEMSRRLGRVQPHFHLLVWGAWFDLEELSETWTSTVWSCLKIDGCLADADGRLVREKHVMAGTNAERVRKWAGVMYCVKTYMTKEEEYPLGKAGRVWGWHNREMLPIAEEQRVELTTAQVVVVKHNLERWMKRHGIVSEYLLRSYFVEDPLAFANEITSGLGLLL